MIIFHIAMAKCLSIDTDISKLREAFPFIVSFDFLSLTNNNGRILKVTAFIFIDNKLHRFLYDNICEGTGVFL